LGGDDDGLAGVVAFLDYLFGGGGERKGREEGREGEKVMSNLISQANSCIR